MSLRDINHQAAIELGELDTEYAAALKQEREQLRDELGELLGIPRGSRTLGQRKRIDRLCERITRIGELLAK